MKRILLVLMSVFMLAFLVGCGNDASKPTESAKPSTSEKITVQAAASLKGALTELADAYKKEHHLADLLHEYFLFLFFHQDFQPHRFDATVFPKHHR